jgi:hypothetical protein
MIKKHPINLRPETKISEKGPLRDLNEFTFKNQGKEELAKTGMFGFNPDKTTDYEPKSIFISSQSNKQGLKPVYEDPDCYNATFFKIPARAPTISI